MVSLPPRTASGKNPDTAGTSAALHRLVADLQVARTGVTKRFGRSMKACDGWQAISGSSVTADQANRLRNGDRWEDVMNAGATDDESAGPDGAAP